MPKSHDVRRREAPRDQETRRSGNPLDAATRRTMEQRFHHSFGDVRVHSDAEGADAARDFDARALTIGSDILFAPGQYDPSSALGTRVLAHELAHVVQNERSEGEASTLPTRAHGTAAEHEAHAAADAVTQGASVDIGASPGSTVATWEWLDRAAGAVEQEGLWNTITDISGAVDRQRAQAELASRFTINDDATAIPAGAPGNVVSREEFQKLSRTYSDIRLGRGDLTIDASPLHQGPLDWLMGNDPAAKYGMNEDQYRDAAMNDMASLLQTRSGRSLVTQLSDNTLKTDSGETRNGFMGMELPQLPFDLDSSLGDPIHHHTTLTPLRNADGTMDTTNGYAAPVGTGQSRQADGSRGSGTDSIVRYNPGVDTKPTNADVAQDPWLPFRSDVLAMHELRHSLDQTQGTFDSTIVQASDGVAFDADGRLRRGEHAAAGLGNYAADPLTENAYRAERNQIGASGVGVRTGDVGMVQRGNYYYHPLATPTTPPVPGSPATDIRLDPHGDHHDEQY